MTERGTRAHPDRFIHIDRLPSDLVYQIDHYAAYATSALTTKRRGEKVLDPATVSFVSGLWAVFCIARGDIPDKAYILRNDRQRSFESLWTVHCTESSRASASRAAHTLSSIVDACLCGLNEIASIVFHAPAVSARDRVAARPLLERFCETVEMDVKALLFGIDSKHRVV